VTGEPFPFFRLEGSAREVGRQHGDHLRDRIQESIDLYTERFASTAGLRWPEVLRRMEQVTANAREHSGELVEEMEGIAEGADVPLAAVVALNARTMLLRTTPTGAGPSGADAECTTGALLPSVTADEHTILFGNWDQNARCLDNSAFLEVRVEGRPAIFMLTEAGILFRSGFNELGIGITGNSLMSDKDTGGTSGVPWPIVRRRVLWHDRIAPAVKEVFEMPRTHSGNHVVADAEGFAIDLEATPLAVFAMTPKSGMITHSNHFLTLGAKTRLLDLQVGRSPSSLYRRERVEAAMRDKRGSITTDDVKAALRDHFGHPQSVCTHPGPTRSVTVASHITDLTTRTMMISSGPPCENAYQTFHLDPS
jgi:isopenicillin-N N-acyltransferase-like protein